MDNDPNLDNTVDRDALDLSDFRPEGDGVMNVPFQEPPDPTTEWDMEDDDFQVFEERLTDAEMSPLDDGSLPQGLKHRPVPVARYRTFVVSAVLNRSSAPYQLLPYHHSRAHMRLYTSGRGVRVAPSMGDLPIVGAIPAMYPDGGSMVEYPPCYHDPIVIDGAEIPESQSVRVWAQVVLEVVND